MLMYFDEVISAETNALRWGFPSQNNPYNQNNIKKTRSVLRDGSGFLKIVSNRKVTPNKYSMQNSFLIPCLTDFFIIEIKKNCCYGRNITTKAVNQKRND